MPSQRGLAKAALEWVPGLQWLMGIPPSTVDYFVHPTHYTSDNTRADLAGTGIAVPPLPSYLQRLVDFVKEHPEVGASGMS